MRKNVSKKEHEKLQEDIPLPRGRSLFGFYSYVKDLPLVYIKRNKW